MGVVLIPGMTIAPADAEIGQTASPVSYAWPNCPGVGHGALMGGVVTSTVEGIETVTVPAGTFEALRISYAGGVVKKTIPLKVVIQNRGISPVMIEDQAMLTGFITLTAESLGHRPDPLPVLVSTRPRNDFPITLDPKESLTVNYEVTLECVNDPMRTTVGAGHYDYRFRATLNHAVLDGKPDDHPFDDTCPRTVTPPYVIDPYPDGTIKDKGCGKPKSDGTFGGDVLLDIVASVS